MVGFCRIVVVIVAAAAAVVVFGLIIALQICKFHLVGFPGF